jgi:hypothetical protein
MRVGFVWLMPLLLAVTACSVQVVPVVRGESSAELEASRNDSITAEEAAFTTQVYDAVLAVDQDWLRAAFVDGITPEAMETGLAEFYSSIPDKTLARADIIAFSRGSELVENQRVHTAQTEYVLVTPEEALTYLRIIIRRTGDEAWEIQNLWSFTVDPATFAIPEQPGGLRNFIRALAIASPSLIVLALLVSWNVRRLKRRILWTAAIVITAPTIAFNWSTQALHILSPGLAQNGEELNLTLINWVMTGTQISRVGDYHPWILTIGLPMGAIWFLLKWAFGGLALTPRPNDTMDRPG